MDNLIDRKVLLREMEKLYNERAVESTMTGNRAYHVTWNDAVYLVTVAPTIEAEPVKHGRWKDAEPAPWGQVYETCSECGTRQTLDKGKDKFCGVCGVRMDGEENESSR